MMTLLAVAGWAIVVYQNWETAQTLWEKVKAAWGKVTSFWS